MKQLKLVVSFVLIAVLLLVGVQYIQNRNETVKIAGTEIPAPYPIADFHLTTVDGRDFTKADFTGKYTVLYFGFTRCPDACPTTLAQFRSEIPKLTAEAHEKVQFLLVTVDPEHDTPALLKAYVEGFHSDIRAVTGTQVELHKIASEMKTTFSKEDENAGDPDLYTMAHSPKYFLIDTEGRLAGVYTPPLAPGVLANDLNLLTAAANDPKSRWMF